VNKIKKFLNMLGPGFITGASDDDPSGIATYSQTGAQFGYSQLWTAPFSFPFMTVVQEMCGRIGMVTGKGLAGNIRKHYALPVLYFAVALLIIANTINIGANLGAMASSGQLISDIPFPVLLIFFTVFTLALEIFVKYKTYSKVLKYLTFSLFAYIIAVFVIKQDWMKVVFSTVFPSFSLNRDYLMNIVAILGTTISPYLFFWESGEVVEEEVEHNKLRMMGSGVPKFTKKDIREMRLDTVIGMFFSNLVMFFIIATTASTLHPHGIRNIETASQAAEALKPLAGDFAFILFALGVIGTGLLSVPVLAGSASYALSEAMGWKEGLYRRFSQAHGFYLVITIATLIGLLANFTPIKPFTLLYYTAILNGICAPPLLIMIMLISGNKKIMGSHTNSLFSNVLGWMITIIMGASSMFLIGALLFGNG
jgi:NRAMP (natural resistance-associated macrophage protein)-like metal ion transporter